MNILAFDTSTDIMYITLGKDDTIIDSRKIESTEQSYNSAFLVSTIAEILKTKHLDTNDIEAVGVNIGPGSFTGLRTSVTVARIIGQQREIPAVGISSFQVFSMLNNTEKNSLCLMDARRGRAYAGIYDKNADAILQPCAMEYEKALELAKSEDFFIISDSRMAKQLEEKGHKFIQFHKSDADFGEFLFKQVLKSLNQKGRKSFKWHDLKPLYIQPPPISTPKKLSIFKED